MFDNQYQNDYSNVPIVECKALIHGETYMPRGTTALLDAIGRTVNDVGQKLSSIEEENRPDKVMVVVITDGQENASREFNKDQIKKLIDEQTNKYKWDFVFLGAGIDAITDGSTLGFNVKKCMSFEKSSIGLRSLGDTVSCYVSSYRKDGDATL